MRFCLHMLRIFEEEEEEEESEEGWEGWKGKRLYSFRDRFVKKITQRTRNLEFILNSVIPKTEQYEESGLTLHNHNNNINNNNNLT